MSKYWRGGGPPTGRTNRPTAYYNPDHAKGATEAVRRQPVRAKKRPLDGVEGTVTKELTEVVEHTAEIVDLDAPLVTESDVRTEYAVGVEVTRETKPGEPPTTSVQATAKVKHTWTEARQPVIADAPAAVRHPGVPKQKTVAQRATITVPQADQEKQETPDQSLDRKIAELPVKMVLSTQWILRCIGLAALMFLLLVAGVVMYHSGIDWAFLFTLLGAAGTAFFLSRIPRGPFVEAYDPAREFLEAQRGTGRYYR